MSLGHYSKIVPILFWQLNIKPLAFQVYKLVKFTLLFFMITLRNHATSVLSQNLRSNAKCSAESPPDMISILLHHALYPGGWPVCFAFWILLGFGQSKAPVANQKMEGKRDGGIYSPDSLFARCRLAMAPHLSIPTA